MVTFATVISNDDRVLTTWTGSANRRAVQQLTEPDKLDSEKIESRGGGNC